jgi:hypothetical protein
MVESEQASGLNVWLGSPGKKGSESKSFLVLALLTG